VELGEGDLIILPVEALQVQAYNVLKGADPITHIPTCGGGGRNTTNGESARIVSGRGGRVRERLLPQLDVGFRGVEFDASEEVYSRPLDPDFGGNAASFERRRFVA
jgi:hypothetical protein